VSIPSDTEGLALALQQTREIMKRCDQLIDRAEREISKVTSIQGQRRPHSFRGGSTVQCRDVD